MFLVDDNTDSIEHNYPFAMKIHPFEGKQEDMVLLHIFDQLLKLYHWSIKINNIINENKLKGITEIEETGQPWIPALPFASIPSWKKNAKKRRLRVRWSYD